MKSILDPSFRYTPSAETDIRKVFSRERKRLKEERKLRPVPPVVEPFQLRKRRV